MNDTPTINKESAALVITELQRQNDFHLQASDVLDDKATTLLEWTSLAIVIVSAISTPDLASSGRIMPFVVLGITVLLYFLMVALSLSVTHPRSYQMPIGLDWEKMCDLYLTQDEQGTLEQLLSQYMFIIEHNCEKTASKSRLVMWATRLFPALVVALVIMATSPLWGEWFI